MLTRILLFFVTYPLLYAETALYLNFKNTPNQVAVATMEKEVETIFSPANLDFYWFQLNDFQSHGELFVITFHGTCTATANIMEIYKHKNQVPDRLAWTDVDSTGVFPFITVDCDGTRNFINTLDESTYGLSLGRIIAHELFHAITGTTKHSWNGIMQSRISRVSLTSQHLLFSKKQYAELRKHQTLAPIK